MTTNQVPDFNAAKTISRFRTEKNNEKKDDLTTTFHLNNSSSNNNSRNVQQLHFRI